MSTNIHESIDASAEDVLQPVNKRSRMLSKACETCKLKKSRCDSSRPQCDTCRRKGMACIYREKGQPGLRPGYGKAIERRLTLLEDSMEEMSQSVQDVLSHVRSTGPAASTSMQTADPEASTVRAANDSQAINDAPLWQTSQQLPDVASFTSSPVVERLPPSLSMTGLNDMDSELPSQEILQELVDLFFELVYPWVPLFHKPNFTANLFLPERQIILHGIVVISFRFWRKPDPPAEVRDTHVKTSREQILLKTIDTCSLISTQALALLALDAVGQGPGPRTWNIMSMLVTAAKHLGMARSFPTTNAETNTPLVRNEDPDDDLDLSSIEAEEKRRLFWVIYSLDRFSSVSHGQPGGIDTKSIKLPYPANDEDWGQTLAPEWFQATASVRPNHVHCSGDLWHHNIDLLAFMDRCNQLLIQPVNFSLPAHCQEWQSNFRRLDITLSTWFENLPREIRESPANFDPMWIMVHATFHLISIRMYTVAAFPSTTSPYLRPSSSARGRLRRAIRDVASLTASLRSHEHSQLSPMFAFVVWVAARSLIILWTTGYENTYGSMPADLETLLSGLRQLSILWSCAQRYNDIIQLILNTKNSPGGPRGLEIFNDTRRTSYGLQHCLGTGPAHRVTEVYPHSFDFLDVPSLDVGELAAPWVGPFGSENDGEWL